MTAQRRNEADYGPSWYDITIAIAEHTKAHGRGVLITAYTTCGTRSRDAICWRVASVRLLQRSPGDDDTVILTYWPNVDFRTVPAMLLEALHRLDWQRTQLAEESERQAAF